MFRRLNETFVPLHQSEAWCTGDSGAVLRFDRYIFDAGVVGGLSVVFGLMQII
jgi:hypothetical protein